MLIKEDNLYGINCNEVQLFKDQPPSSIFPPDWEGLFYILQDDDGIAMTPSQVEQLVIELTKLITTTT